MSRIYSGGQMAAHFIHSMRSAEDTDWQLFLDLLATVEKQAQEADPADKIYHLWQELLNAKEQVQEFEEAKEPKSRRYAFNEVASSLGNAVFHIEELETGNPEVYSSISKKVEALDARNLDGGREVLAELSDSEPRSASAWIEQFQKEAKKGEEIGINTVAKIFAARQLANAVRGRRGNIDRAQLTEEEILAKADQLKKSPVFTEYFENHRPTAKLVRDGHGGRMEMGFDAFVKAREDCQELDSRLYGRYQFKHDCKTYKDFLERNGMSGEPFKKLSADEQAMQAAKMFAAATLQREKKGAAFNEATLNSKAAAIVQWPAFRLAMREPGMLEKAAAGDVLPMLERTGKLGKAFTDREEHDAAEQEMLLTFRNKLAGHKDWTPEESKRLAQNPGLVEKREKYWEAVDKLNAYSKEDAELAMMTRSDEELRENAGTSRLLQKHSVEYVRAKEAKWRESYGRRKQEITRDKTLSAEEKQKRIQEVNQEMEREWQRGKEVDAAIHRDLAALDKAQASYRKAARETYGESLSRKEFRREEEKYLKGRSDSYRRMFEAVDGYMMKAACEEQAPEDKMEAVLSILEYQDGKEGRGGGIRERVDLSMRVLARLTVAFQNQNILDRQIEKVNAARGLREGQKGFLTRAALYEEAAQNNDLYERIEQFMAEKGLRAENDLDDEEPEVEEAEAEGNAGREDEELDFDDSEPQKVDEAARLKRIKEEQDALDEELDPEANIFI